MPVESFILQHYPRNDVLYLQDSDEDSNTFLTVMHKRM